MPVLKTMIAFAIVIIDIYALIDILISKMSADKKVLWMLIIVLLPIIGLILYFLLGRKKK